MNLFIQALQAEKSHKLTENGAFALNTSGNDLLDFYSTMGAMRERSDSDIINAFDKAFYESPTYAMKALFYARDVRGGLGERRLVRVIFKHLAEVMPDVMKKNLNLVAEYGRWDDLLVFIDTSLEKAAFEVIKTQLFKDAKDFDEGKSISLLAKWMPSENAHAKETIRAARKLIKYMNLDPRTYRKVLSALRAKLQIVEATMSANKWMEINYEAVPSKAMNNYHNAFKRHNVVGFDNFIKAVEKGEKTIKAATLFPYDLVMKLSSGWGFSLGQNYKVDAAVEAQWKALPNYVEDGSSVMVIADTSGSMESNGGLPMATSVGLALYFAERNKGPFHNKFITFSSRPSFVEIKGNTLREKLRGIPEIVDNTNLEAALMLILDTAVKYNVPQSDLPQALVIISDMEIDCVRTQSGQVAEMTFTNTMKKRFANSGYTLPNLIYWNVNARNDTFHANGNQRGIQLVSGQSASVFKNLINNLNTTPYKAMIKVLSAPRYEAVVAQ